jgi:hypothetical protein
MGTISEQPIGKNSKLTHVTQEASSNYFTFFARALDLKMPWCAVTVFHGKVISFNFFPHQSMVCEISNAQILTDNLC